MKIERLIAILIVLLQKDIVNAPWLAEKFGVSVRTIYRDIATLEAGGIPIVTQAGIKGGISIVDSYKIDKGLFTNSDISILLTSLQGISGSIEKAKLNQTLEKIRALIPKEHNKSIELQSKQLYIDISPWASNSIVAQTIEIVQKSLTESRLLCIEYAGMHETSKGRIIEPHQLVLKENNWYVKAFCRQKQSFRIFKISRIKAVTFLEENFIPKEFETAMPDYKEWGKNKKTEIEILIDENLREKALSYCSESSMKEIKGGKIEVKTWFVESDMGYGMLLSLGHQCVVMSPAHVREELKRRIQLLTEAYQ